MLSFIVPYSGRGPLNPPKPMPGDEVLIVDSGLSIWQARLLGALRARNEWLVFCDADAYYPSDYALKIREAIASGRYPLGFLARRVGGLAPLNPKGNTEARLVVRKDVFFERVKLFRPAGPKSDFGGLFKDLPVAEEVVMYHGLTHGERAVVFAASPMALGATLLAASLSV